MLSGSTGAHHNSRFAKTSIMSRFSGPEKRKVVHYRQGVPLCGVKCLGCLDLETTDTRPALDRERQETRQQRRFLPGAPCSVPMSGLLSRTDLRLVAHDGRTGYAPGVPVGTDSDQASARTGSPAAGPNGLPRGH